MNRAAHSSSQSLLIEINEPVVNPWRTWPVDAVVDSLEERGTRTDFDAFIRKPLAAATLGPVGVDTGWEH